MKPVSCIRILLRFLFALTLLLFALGVFAQINVAGSVLDVENRDPIIGAHVRVTGTSEGTVTDHEGSFILSIPGLPATLIATYIGYDSAVVKVSVGDRQIEILMKSSSRILDVVQVQGDARSDAQKRSAHNIETIDRLYIRQIASHDIYEGASSLRGMDGLTVGFGNVVLNSRGFASTSPVRSLQIIDGVDNQSPGLNFSLGNFLGAPDLDILSIALIQGPSSAFYGPNAFNGVIDIHTRDPFIHQGLEVSMKYGERNLMKGEFRYAHAFKNADGYERFAFKINGAFMRANDWEATNYTPTDQSPDDTTNAAGYDAVNIYGDEYSPDRDLTGVLEGITYPGLNRFYRKGYAEKDLVDYNTRNVKGNLALHYRLDSNIQIIGGFNFGSGTTVYQGENRFRLKDIFFWQGKLEIKQDGKFFLRAYLTEEDAGKTYDAYSTALRLQAVTKTNTAWDQDYLQYWQTRVVPRYRKLPDDPVVREDSLRLWHFLTQNHSNSNTFRGDVFYEPGSVRFDSLFNLITGNYSSDPDFPGTRFYDKSGLYHVHGEYVLNPSFGDITIGANYRQYNPDSKGTIFSDTSEVTITNREFGVYAGITKQILPDRLALNVSARMDKNQNFNLVASPAASLVYTPDDAHTFRLSMSSALRNPTLTDQYLYLDVGRALLLGNITGYDSLITLESFRKYRNCICVDSLEYFDVAAIRPEKAKSVELGYRGYPVSRLWVDASYYHSWYKDFIGYQIGIKSKFNEINFPVGPRAWRVAANSASHVTTQGFSLSTSYRLSHQFTLTGNYSWNVLKKKADDPLIPAYNTPKHKFNIGISGREIRLPIGKSGVKGIGFSINYKWIEGFLFEGSPQFTGRIPTYDLLDVQVNWTHERSGITFKVGATNILNRKHYQVYGGPQVGRLAYVSVLYQAKTRRQ